MNNIIGFETAKLLKEKGYDKPCSRVYEHALTTRKYEKSFEWVKGDLILSDSSYFINNNPNSDFSDKNWFICAAPTIYEIITWLHEKHNIWVYIFPTVSPDKTKILWKGVYLGSSISKISPSSNEFIEETCFEFYETVMDVYITIIKHILNKLIK